MELNQSHVHVHVRARDFRLVTHQIPLHAGSLISQSGDEPKSFFFVHWGRYYLYHRSQKKLNMKIIMSRQKSWRLKILRSAWQPAAGGGAGGGILHHSHPSSHSSSRMLALQRVEILFFLILNTEQSCKTTTHTTASSYPRPLGLRSLPAGNFSSSGRISSLGLKS